MPAFISLIIRILHDFLPVQPLLLPHHPAGRLLLVQHCSNTGNQSSKSDIAAGHHKRQQALPQGECLSDTSSLQRL
ncbi:hypothetical protein [Aquitalea aquatica]|uniref:Uncharacterized protein n=1 Tax=Aquitalea aquatica TaxID=3044273 RepID=A0A838Y4Q1_9NEIS|nr:hypothetical protein [Aquitalea magnusonii]MBA4710420.1 hypothetical protein [Aquitalea magnusonii]